MRVKLLISLNNTTTILGALLYQVGNCSAARCLVVTNKVCFSEAVAVMCDTSLCISQL